MNRFRKLTSFLLALALILSLLGGMGPVAAEAKGNDSFDFTAVVVNPLYQDVISEEDIPLPQKSSSWGGVAAIAEPDYLDGEEEAALAIREAMVNREAAPVIYFTSTFAVSTQEEFEAMLKDLLSKAYAHTGVPNEGDYLRWHYGGYSAGISGGYGEDNTTIYYELSLELVYYTTAAQEAEVDAKIHQLMDSWDVDNEHDYIILKTIYDYICANVVYDHEHVNDQSYKMQFTAYAALIDDVAVCQGYANLFYRMALEYGIDARLIAGDGGGAHGWNIAQLNGLYYNLDSTWDAGYTDYGYFLVCPDNFTDHIRYEEYDTAAFHAAYPMDDADFDPNSMGCSHTYGKPVDTATCTQAGTKTYTCTQCGETKTETSPALGHSGGTASCTQLAVCTVCGEAYGELTDHEYADEWASDADNHWLPCQNCENKSNIAAHTPNVEAATEDTEKYCTICGYVMEEAVCATVQRIAGETRYETGINSANALKEIYGVEKFNTIILACGGFGGENDNGFADALTGSYLAYVTKAPILMHSSEPSVEDSIEANMAYIQENLASDGIVYILGGEISVPTEFEGALTDAGIQVERLAGEDRFVTNLEILKKTMELEQALEEDAAGEKEILISSGWGYADSLSIGATGLPILLLKGNNAALMDSQIEFLNTYKDDYKITIVGGPAAVSEAVEAAVEEIVGKDVGRLSGEAREETSVAVAKAYFNEPEFAVLAYSYEFYDGLCGGPVARAMNAPLLLTNTNKTPMATTSAYLEEMDITAGYVMGVVDLLNDNAVKTLFGLPSDTVIPSV